MVDGRLIREGTVNPRRTGRGLILAGVFLASAARADEAAPAPGSGGGATATSSHCGEEVWGLDPLLSPGAVTIVGEIHGTAEIPRRVGDVACRAARAGHRVVIGLELPHAMQPLADAFLDSGGSPDDVGALLRGEGWGLDDGRGSRAMLALLERMRALRGEGHDVRVELFDAAYDAERDANMATHLATALDAAPDAVAVVLVGNLHARAVRPWMAWHLRRLHPFVRTVLARHAAGTAWLSTPEGVGPTRVGGEGLGDEPYVQLFATAEDGYDGIFYVGAVSASPPARTAGSD